jgi:hypothetical protein
MSNNMTRGALHNNHLRMLIIDTKFIKPFRDNDDIALRSNIRRPMYADDDDIMDDTGGSSCNGLTLITATITNSLFWLTNSFRLVATRMTQEDVSYQPAKPKSNSQQPRIKSFVKAMGCIQPQKQIK